MGRDQKERKFMEGEGKSTEAFNDRVPNGTTVAPIIRSRRKRLRRASICVLDLYTGLYTKLDSEIPIWPSTIARIHLTHADHCCPSSRSYTLSLIELPHSSLSYANFLDLQLSLLPLVSILQIGCAVSLCPRNLVYFPTLEMG